MRFNLIDRIVEVRPGRGLQAVKNLTLGEEYLADHFPTFPVMPGVLMLETLVEAGAWLRAQYFPRGGEKDWLETVSREVRTVRSAVGFCDVSTLGKIEVHGADAGVEVAPEDRVHFSYGIP